MKVVLLWLVVGAIWLGLNPYLRLPKNEGLLLLLSFFFFTGVQKFHDDREMMRQATEHQIAVPFGQTKLSRLWMQAREPLFATCGLVCIGVFAFWRLIR